MPGHSPEHFKVCPIFRMKKWFLFLVVVPVLLVLSYAVSKPNVNRKAFLVVSNSKSAYNTPKPTSHPHEIVKSGSHDNTRSTMTSFDDVTTVSFAEVIPNSNSTTSLNVSLEQQQQITASKTVIDLQLQNLTQNRGTAVMLLTYMRSGSSLTGDILQQPKDAFYVFEPLKSADHIYRHGGVIRFINGTYLPIGTYDLQHVYKETMYGWLSCDLLRVHAQSLLDFSFLTYGHKFKNYIRCTRNLRLNGLLHKNRLHESKEFMSCLYKVQQVCLSSKYRIVKTIRLRMELAKTLFDRIPNSKILNLIRDPRATIESKRHRNVCHDGITKCIDDHCADVRKDTEVKQYLTSVAPDRVSHVLYEDIASRPLDTSKTMYSFIGMDFTDTIAEYVYNLTLGKDKSGCEVCLTAWQIGKSSIRSDTRIGAWKQVLPRQYINEAQMICQDIIKFYGYEYYMAPPKRKSIIEKAIGVIFK